MNKVFIPREGYRTQVLGWKDNKLNKSSLNVCCKV